MENNSTPNIKKMYITVFITVGSRGALFRIYLNYWVFAMNNSVSKMSCSVLIMNHSGSTMNYSIFTIDYLICIMKHGAPIMDLFSKYTKLFSICN